MTSALPPWPPDLPGVRAAIADLIDSGQWGQANPDVLDRLQQLLSESFAVKQVVLTSSGTAAIEMALRAVRLADDSEVVLAGYDYPGNIRAVEAVGAKPVVVDVEEGRFATGPQQVEAAMSDATAAILVSHLHGNLLDAKDLRALADSRNVVLIEDACQVHGATVDQQPAGSWGHFGVLSFGGSKLMTAGCGGALLTNDARLAGRARQIAERPSAVSPLSPLQAAVLLPQFEMLAPWKELRRRGANQLRERLSGSQLWRFPQPSKNDDDAAYYKLAWLLPPLVDRDALINTCRAAGLPVGKGFVGFLRRAEKRYRTVGDLANSRNCLENAVMIDHRVLLADCHLIDHIADLLIEIEHATLR